MKDTKIKEAMIGLEIHVELGTESKLFCSCSRKAGRVDSPNTRTCVTCLGHPGSKPVLNGKAIDFAIKLGLALNCKINTELIFSRKSYFYPDLAKNYQITQFEIPLAQDGFVSINSVKSGAKKIGIQRVHLEEDPGALVHPNGITDSNYVLVDYNRSGNPLAEVVTDPDMTSPEEARDFMKQLITIIKYLNIYDPECVVKADANISIPPDYTRTEIKNITGFKDIERALKYEIIRHREIISTGKKVLHETRGWDADKGHTYSIRSKETEDDYGYIIEPNLIPIPITAVQVNKIKKSMPELATARVRRFIKKYKVDKTDALIIAMERSLADIFEKVAAKIDPVIAAKWMRMELLRVMNYNKTEAEDLLIDERHIIDLLRLIQDGKISDEIAKKVIERLVQDKNPRMPSDIVKGEGLEKINDTGELESISKQVLNDNPNAVEEISQGNDKALNFLVGQVMRHTKGKADARQVKQIISSIIKI